jgi:hypothetical protein
MIYFIPFKAEHFGPLELQPQQAWMKEFMTVEKVRTIEGRYAVSIVKDGEIIACWGAAPIEEMDRALVWTYLGNKVDRYCFREMHHLGRRHLDVLPYKRLEAIVQCDHDEGHRWVVAMGFEIEAVRMRNFKRGRDCALYARIQD